MNIVIVGCGSLGSWLSFCICLRNNMGFKIGKITLIDYDIITPSNLPYLFFSPNNYKHSNTLIGKSKSLVLSKVLINIFGKYAEIISIEEKYSDFINKKKENNEYWIDCRDDPSEDKIFNLKCSIDYSFGKIIINPKNNPKYLRTSCSISNNPFFSMCLSTIICNEYIFSLDKIQSDKRIEIIYNLKGKLDERIMQIFDSYE